MEHLFFGRGLLTTANCNVLEVTWRLDSTMAVTGNYADGNGMPKITTGR